MRWAFVPVLFTLLFPFLPVFAQSEETEPVSLFINEVSRPLYPGDIGWVELKQSSSGQLDLTGWRLVNNSGQDLLLNVSLSPDQLLVIPWDQITESTNQLRLLNQNGDRIDDAIFPSSERTFARVDSTWQATSSPTPGRANLFVSQEPVTCDEQQVPVLPTPNNPSPITQTAPLRLSELFANPVGDETSQEFIELYNPLEQTISLHGWKIADLTKSFSLDGMTIQARQYLVLPRSLTGIALNNSNEAVRLTDPFEMIIDEVSYETTHEGTSLNRDTTGLYEAEPTPGMPNQVKPEDPEEETIEEATPVNTQEEAIPDEVLSEEETITPPTGLIISELLPNPVGSDTQEWIELQNSSDKIITLNGVTISDEKTSYALPDRELTAGAFLLLHRSDTKISLNNDSDHLILSFGDLVLDSFEYEESEEGQSWSKSAEGIWLIAPPTPDEANAQSAENASSEEEPIPSPKVTTAASGLTVAELDSWHQIANKTSIQIEGVLTVLPGTFNARTARLQSVNGSTNIEIYFHKALWPPLELGNLIRVQGEKSITQTADRLLIRSADDITFLDEFDLLPLEIDVTTNLGEIESGALITVEGELIEQTKDQLLLDVFGSELPVSLKKAKLNLPRYVEGGIISVEGLLERTADGPSLIIRSIEDVRGEEALTLPTSESAPPLETPATREQSPTVPIVIGSAAAAFAGKKFVLQSVKPFLQTLFNRSPL